MAVEDNRQAQEMSRRKFLARFVEGAVAAVSAAMAVPLIGYFLSPVFAKAPSKQKVTIARASDIAVGTPTLVTFQETVQDGWVKGTEKMGAWVVTTDGQNFTVFDPHCTHLGCLYAWNPGKRAFDCPCHASFFDINGNVIAGPAPRALEKLPSSVADGAIQVTM